MMYRTPYCEYIYHMKHDKSDGREKACFIPGRVHGKPQQVPVGPETWRHFIDYRISRSYELRQKDAHPVVQNPEKLSVQRITD